MQMWPLHDYLRIVFACKHADNEPVPELDTLANANIHSHAKPFSVRDSLWNWNEESRYEQFPDTDFFAKMDVEPDPECNAGWHFLSISDRILLSEPIRRNDCIADPLGNAFCHCHSK